ncbi:SIR2 family NAD-dependent protein deacylase [Halosegnis marinus]|uniref:NAD-dependent deacetylase n=1 Tax=Halosegnis marinus TaxID=3034023 RepID=A0ABD5ZRR8_9EURY|nr:NAD-dependent protein deacylase [Halosegnis sp. DT85]
MHADIAAAADRLRVADSVVAFTGAGVSTASGIPDFRSEGGIWERWNPDDFHVRRFRADPDGFWRDRAAMVAEVYDGPEPNAAHEALADLESAGVLDRVVTQNVDGLHTAAGSENVVEIHGSGDRVACTDCGTRRAADPYYESVRAGEVDGAPRCPDCDGVLKPDVVLFGEAMPTGPLGTAKRLAREADAFLVVGSSLTVEPAASLPGRAADTGADLFVANLDPTRVSERAAFDFRADVTEVLPALRDRVLGRG